MRGGVCMVGHGYAIFDTTIGRCGIIWSSTGVVAVQLPAFTYFFYNDDYVPFAEIVDNGIPRYLSNLILVQDITPNWRVVPGLFYLAGKLLKDGYVHSLGGRALLVAVLVCGFGVGVAAGVVRQVFAVSLYRSATA